MHSPLLHDVYSILFYVITIFPYKLYIIIRLHVLFRRSYIIIFLVQRNIATSPYISPELMLNLLFILFLRRKGGL